MKDFDEMMNEIDSNITNDILKVLERWAKPTRHFFGVWFGYDELHDECGAKYSIKQLKAGMKRLSQAGKVELKTTYNEDMELNGKGWFITEK